MIWNRFLCLPKPCDKCQPQAPAEPWAGWFTEQFSVLNGIWIKTHENLSPAYLPTLGSPWNTLTWSHALVTWAFSLSLKYATLLPASSFCTCCSLDLQGIFPDCWPFLLPPTPTPPTPTPPPPHLIIIAQLTSFVALVSSWPPVHLFMGLS